MITYSNLTNGVQKVNVLMVPKQLNGVLNRVGYFGEILYLQNKKVNCILQDFL